MEAKRAALVARVVILAMTGCHAPAPGTNVDAPTIDAGVVKTVTADGLQRLFTHARPDEQGGENVLGRLKTVATEMCRKQGLGAHVLQTSWGIPLADRMAPPCGTATVMSLVPLVQPCPKSVGLRLSLIEKSHAPARPRSDPAAWRRSGGLFVLGELEPGCGQGRQDHAQARAR
ncbi:hypothetical protein [Dokdonella sp.]|uniref:hypothetical protein n=1 Tax=Dokdonella sp. TaxID=2291710 RepID=UPI0025B97310|nr:hypothetical protein [Dokdonella sp.]